MRRAMAQNSSPEGSGSDFQFADGQPRTHNGYAVTRKSQNAEAERVQHPARAAHRLTAALLRDQLSKQQDPRGCPFRKLPRALRRPPCSGSMRWALACTAPPTTNFGARIEIIGVKVAIHS